MTQIYVDADACPVKDEIYRVAKRCQLQVIIVANAWMRTPDEPWAKLVVVGDGLDEADDRIAERVETHDIVITADIPLASRCVGAGAYVISPRGKIFDETGIGDVLATRDLMTQLREAGMASGGPPPFSKKDRSKFLQGLDQLVQQARRELVH